MILQHREQTTATGCLYHALYALTGEESVLAHVEDDHDARFAARLAELGILLFPFWITFPTHPPPPVGFWDELRSHLQATAPSASGIPLLLTIPTRPGHGHTVAIFVSLEGDEVQVSDSNAPDLLTLEWGPFLLSEYARPYRVEMLGPLDLDAYSADRDPH